MPFVEPRVELTLMPEMTLLGFARRMPKPGPGQPNLIPAFWDEFFQAGLLERLPESVIPGLLLGACWDESEDGSFQYMICVPVRTECPTPAGQTRLELPETRCARITAKGELSLVILETFRWIHHDWLPASGFQLAPGAHLEWYDHRAQGGETAEVDLLIPIQ